MRLLIRLTERSLSDVFTAFVVDLVQHVAASQSESECVTVVVSRLRRWQRFFDDTSCGLPLERQKGLFGELLLMRDFLSAWLGALSTVSGWGGPHCTRQDFQFASTAIEVKTTTTQHHQHLTISSERQLDATGLQRLYLAHFSLDAREGGEGLSLPALVQQVRNLMTLDAVARGMLDDALLAAGYLDVHANQYDGVRYTYRAHLFLRSSR